MQVQTLEINHLMQVKTKKPIMFNKHRNDKTHLNERAPNGIGQIRTVVVTGIRSEVPTEARSSQKFSG